MRAAVGKWVVVLVVKEGKRGEMDWGKKVEGDGFVEGGSHNVF